MVNLVYRTLGYCAKTAASRITNCLVDFLLGNGLRYMAIIGQIQMLSEQTMIRQAKFQIGQVVKHRVYPFRGVVFDVDPIFDNTDEWYEAIPEEIRPSKDQPFYHLFAENEETEYIAYVSEQNLLADDLSGPLRHPQINEVFRLSDDGNYVAIGGYKH